MKYLNNILFLFPVNIACVDDMVVKNNCTTNNGTWYNKTCVYSDMVDNETFHNIKEMTANIKHVSASEEYFQ